MELQLDLGGYKVIISDTAGVRASSDEIENEGIRRAINAAEEADIVIHVVDSTVRDATRIPTLLDDAAPCKRWRQCLRSSFPE